jgi:release factor glutamine methyltransferase
MHTNPPPVADLLRHAYARLNGVSSTPRLDAQLLLACAMGCERAYVLAFGEHLPTSQQAEQFLGWLERRTKGEPIAYILGRRAFYDREFKVTPAVLIPRPETEHLLEAALEITAALESASDRPLVAADIGTGSGAIAVTYKAHAPQVTVYAVDVSPEALAVAQTNAQRLDITFLQGDLAQPLLERGVRVDVLMANLPYIATDDLSTLEVRKHEPTLALDGGADGLDLIRRLLQDAPALCNTGACILLEIGSGQGAATSAIAQDIFPHARVEVMPDYAGHERVVIIRL